MADASAPKRSAFEHPLALGSLRSWLRVLARSGGIDRTYVPRALAVTATTLVTSPLRRYESLRYGRIVARTAVDPSPVFILGHWRTGTTHLHALLCRDPQFGYVSTFEAMAPGFCLTGAGAIERAIARGARKRHPTREIDNIPLDLDAPQEESFALANLTPFAPLHLYSVPRRAAEIFSKYALFDGIDEGERAEWTRAYLTVLRKATLRSGGKPLVLKDPAHSARIPALLELFPNARFVHICRDPYRVIASMEKTFRIVLGMSQLQDLAGGEVENLVLRFYERLMRKYLAERKQIPDGRLVEVAYETLDAAPVDEVGRIYDALGLSGFSVAEPAIRAYADSVRGFEKNAYRVDDRVIASVNRSLVFALEAFGYPRREPSGAAVPGIVRTPGEPGG